MDQKTNQNIENTFFFAPANHGCGLCNQLFAIVVGMINGLHLSDKKTPKPVHIVISDIWGDYKDDTGVYIRPENFFDLPATNSKLAKLGIMLHSKHEKPEYATALYHHVMTWPTPHVRQVYDAMLSSFSFNRAIIARAREALVNNGITCPGKDKCNLLHLRIEEDGITHWSRMNHMSADLFRTTIVDKYIHLVKTYIKPGVPTFIMTYKVDDNPVIEYMKQAGYKYIILSKEDSMGREYNAVIDFVAAEMACNGIFIGNVDGSSFSYSLMTRMLQNKPGRMKRLVSIDLDRITQEEKTTNTSTI